MSHFLFSVKTLPRYLKLNTCLILTPQICSLHFGLFIFVITKHTVFFTIYVSSCIAWLPSVQVFVLSFLFLPSTLWSIYLVSLRLWSPIRNPSRALLSSLSFLPIFLSSLSTFYYPSCSFFFSFFFSSSSFLCACF